MASSILGFAGSQLFGPVGGFVGAVIGNALTPQEEIKNEGPRISDRQVLTTGYGQAIPIAYGTVQLSGHVIEPQNFELDETKHESSSGGKGGGPSVTNTSYSYSATFAMMICKGPINGVRKIWLNSDLVYDVSDDADAVTLVQSNEIYDEIRIYNGTEDQQPDSILEAINGVGNTPAYRGYSYMVVDKLQLGNYGNSLPNIRVEIVASGTEAVADRVARKNDHDVDFDDHVIVGYDNGIYRIWDQVPTLIGGTTGKIHLVDANGNYYGSEPAKYLPIHMVSPDAYPIPRSGHVSIGPLGTGFATQFPHLSSNYTNNYPSPAGTADLTIAGWLEIPGFEDALSISPRLPQDRQFLGVTLSADQKRMIVVMGEVGKNNTTSHTTGVWHMFDENLDEVDSGTANFVDATATPSGIGLGEFGFGNLATAFASSMMESDYRHIWVHYSAGTENNRVWWIDDDGELAVKYELSIDAATEGFGTASIYADNGIMMVCGQNDANTDGLIATYSRNLLITETSVTLESIVDDLQAEAGVPAASIDNSALTDTVAGYLVARQTSARQAIEPLQTAYLFDTIESDYALKSVKRGGASVATIPIEDMGARPYGTEASYPLEKTRLQEIEMPIEVIVNYQNASRGYEQASQRSRRLTPQSSEKKTIDIPIPITDDKARQLAEILHYGYYSERKVYRFSLMPKYAYLDPSDVITITDGAESIVVRIVSMTMTTGGAIECDAVGERPEIYQSSATGASTTDTITINQRGPTKAIYGDWPMFDQRGNDEGIYIAATGLLSGWTAAVISKSSDGGASFNEAATVASAASMGYTTDTLADGPVETFDYGNTVNVFMTGGATLSSSTKANVLNGANPIMIGSELIQFVTATLETDGSYTLSTLLRGRKGTEWATGGHDDGEDAVLINENLTRTMATLNAEHQYKATTVGNFVADSYEQAVTYTGVNLKPYSPAHIKGTRDSSDDISIEWVRRSRFGAVPLWSPQLGEETEEYELDIYNGSTIVRAITGLTSPAYTYDSADQVTDFGSAQASVDIIVYQKSAIIGRGYAGSATV